MLTKLLPDQISKFWDIIKYGIEESLPPVVSESPDKMNNILTSLLVDKTQCWASYEKTEKGNRFEGIVLTRIMFDDASMTRNLLIYCLYGFEEVSKESWLGGLKAMLKYAKSKRCAQIIGYTNIPSLVKIASRFGADSTYHFISIDVNKIVQNLNELEQKYG